jgi:hypothetical protein
MEVSKIDHAWIIQDNNKNIFVRIDRIFLRNSFTEGKTEEETRLLILGCAEKFNTQADLIRALCSLYPRPE